MSNFLKTWLEERGRSAKVKSQAMSAPVWFVGLVLTACVVALGICPAKYYGYFFGVAVFLIVVCVVLFVAAYVYWAKRDPDRLGTETHLRQMKVIQALEESKDPIFLQALNATAREAGPDRNPPAAALKKGGNPIKEEGPQ